MGLFDFAFKNFWSQLASTPAGRRHIYSFAIAAEEGDEHGVFDMLADNLQNIEFKKLVRAHQADEERHAGLFKECLDRMGVSAEKIPGELQIIRRMGGKFGAEGEQSSKVVELYAMLRAIEVRGVEQFPIIAEALRPYDVFGADTFLAVAADEKKHVGFCDRIGKSEAESLAAWNQAVAKYERVESAAFFEHAVVAFRYVMRNGIIGSESNRRVAAWLFDGVDVLAEKFGLMKAFRLQA